MASAMSMVRREHECHSYPDSYAYNRGLHQACRSGVPVAVTIEGNGAMSSTLEIAFIHS